MVEVTEGHEERECLNIWLLGETSWKRTSVKWSVLM